MADRNNDKMDDDLGVDPDLGIDGGTHGATALTEGAARARLVEVMKGRRAAPPERLADDDTGFDRSVGARVEEAVAPELARDVDLGRSGALAGSGPRPQGLEGETEESYPTYTVTYDDGTTILGVTDGDVAEAFGESIDSSWSTNEVADLLMKMTGGEVGSTADSEEQDASEAAATLSAAGEDAADVESDDETDDGAEMTFSEEEAGVVGPDDDSQDGEDAQAGDDGDDGGGDGDEPDDQDDEDDEDDEDEAAFGEGDTGMTTLDSEFEDRSGAALHDPLNEDALERVGERADSQAGDSTLRIAGDGGPGGSEWIEGDLAQPGGPTDVDPAEPIVTADDLAHQDLEVDHRVIDPADDFDPA